MFRIEFRRAILNRNILAGIIFGLAALWFGLSDYWLISDDPDYLATLPSFYNNAFDAFIWAHQSSLYGLIAPILAVLPFADSYFIDRQSGFLRSLLMRTSYKKYLLIKYLSTSISGGLVLAIPLLVFYLYVNLVFPRGLNPDPFSQRLLMDPAAFGPFGTTYSTHPDNYIFTLIGLAFLYGAVFSILGLMVSTFARNRYIAIATPFVVFILIHFFLSVFGLPAWSPLSTLTPHWLAAGIGWIQMIVGLGSIYLVGTLGFFIGTFSQKIRA